MEADALFENLDHTLRFRAARIRLFSIKRIVNRPVRRDEVSALHAGLFARE